MESYAKLSIGINKFVFVGLREEGVSSGSKYRYGGVYVCALSQLTKRCLKASYIFYSDAAPTRQQLIKYIGAMRGSRVEKQSSRFGWGRKLIRRRASRTAKKHTSTARGHATIRHTTIHTQQTNFWHDKNTKQFL
jgi:hypothetical protein